jgi:GNAT superfamily N-acetyltransferase
MSAGDATPAAMTDTAAVDLELDSVPYDSPLARVLVAEVQQEYTERYGSGDQARVEAADFTPPHGVFLVARAGAEVVGCVGLRRHGPAEVELKRLYVRAAHRRRGHARHILRAVEERARALGYARVVLETGTEQPEAIALYASEGYALIPGFGHYAGSPLSRSFGKDLHGRGHGG